jgi:hypothetical protein
VTLYSRERVTYEKSTGFVLLYENLKISVHVNVSSYMNSMLSSEYIIYSQLFNRKFVSCKLQLKCGIQLQHPPSFPSF